MEKAQIQTLKTKVEIVLEKFPDTRNDDVALTIKVWRVFHKEKLNFEYVKLSDLFALPREDTIKRVRAQIQNKDGRFLPTVWEVAKKRQGTQWVKISSQRSKNKKRLAKTSKKNILLSPFIFSLLQIWKNSTPSKR